MCVPAASQLYSTYVDKRLYLDTHPDQKNIKNPYGVGATLLATSHTPSSNTCRPFPRPTDDVRERIRTRHPAELCLEYLPDRGTPGDRQLHLTITEQLQVSECENSQVVTARPLAVQGQPLPFNVARDGVVAAKFYDPLYNDHILIDAWKSVDYSYRNEAQAYQRLEPLQGVVVPCFYGSYTVDIPVPQVALQHHHHHAQPAGPVRVHQRHTAVIGRGPSLQHKAAPGHHAQSPRLVQQDAPARRVPLRLSPRQHHCAIRRTRSRG
ncbi:hypothetical protein G3M48_006829 [Beauveria asiatica]|uniref:Uncharacterized protein n=1 Tax=Beauveria asiatica TaxID=1069075 RepID=A0AAW0RNS3_9HYPO